MLVLVPLVHCGQEWPHGRFDADAPRVPRFRPLGFTRIAVERLVHVHSPVFKILLQQLAIGAVGVAAVAAVALTDDNMGGVAASTIVIGALEYFKAKAKASATMLGAAEYAALFDEFRKLDERVEKLEDQDRRDVLSRQATYSRFARDVSEAATTEKREALVHATAYQFDPRKGPSAMRDYWLRRLRDLHEPQLSLILLIQHWMQLKNDAFEA